MKKKIMCSCLVLFFCSLLEARASFIYPVQDPYVTSSFQLARKHPTLGIVRPHKGVDFRAPTGAPIFASYKGKVEAVKRSPSFGNVIILIHRIAGQIYRTLYAHLSSFVKGLREGLSVRAGQCLGKAGSTGQARGPHLHFELHKGTTPVDPLPYLQGKRKLHGFEKKETFKRSRSSFKKKRGVQKKRKIFKGLFKGIYRKVSKKVNSSKKRTFRRPQKKSWKAQRQKRDNRKKLKIKRKKRSRLK